MFRVFTLFLLTASIAVGQPIVFPKQEVVPKENKESVEPVNKPLTPGLIYDIQAKTDCVIKAFPEGRVSITKEVVPEGQTFRDRGRFWSGAKDKLYVGPVTIYNVKPTGKGPVNIVVIPVGFKTESDIGTTSLDVDDGEVKPIDEQKQKPKPAKVKSVRLAVVMESADKSALKVQYLQDEGLVKLWKDRGWDPAWWIDPNVIDPTTKTTPARWAPYVAQANELKLPITLFVVNRENGEVVYEGAPPEGGPAGLLKLLKEKTGE